MRLSVTILLFFWSICLNASKDIRADFHQPHKLTEAELEAIIDNNSYANSAVTLAYKGMCETMLAQFAFLPTTKYSYWVAGKEKIEKAVQLAPNNAEVRYVRLLIQLNCPSFLSYDDAVDQDLTLFTSKIKSQGFNQTQINTFVLYLSNAEHITEEQKQKINALKK